MIVHGARQVGKTYIIKQFGKKYYEDLIYVNFETNKEISMEIGNKIDAKYIINKLELFYGKAKIDFMIQKNADIIPIEVKTSIHTKSRSLDLYMKKYEPKYSIRISEKNFGIENNIKSVPLYAVFCI